MFAKNNALRAYRQRLVYSAGPHGMEPLADNETLGGAGVARDGSAKLSMTLADLTDLEILGEKVSHFFILLFESAARLSFTVHNGACSGMSSSSNGLCFCQ